MKIVSIIERILLKTIRQLFYFCKVKNNRVVFMNFAGRGYGDSPKYITEYLLKNYSNLDLVWITYEDQYFPQGVRSVKYGTLKAYYMLGTAHVWVDNVRYSKGIKKKKSQFYLQTWHASFSQKKLEKEAEDLIGRNYVKQAKNDGKIVNLMLSNSLLQTKDFRTNFWYDGEIMECGYPRNDVLLKESNNYKKIEIIKQNLEIKKDDKVVLFAPTFRDSNDLSNYILDYEELRNSVSVHYGSHAVVLVRLHPNVARIANGLNYGNGIINVTGYPDMQELLLISDLLITDYSSSIFDMMLINKDIIVYATDVQEYHKKRGLKELFWKLPFPLFQNEKDMYKFIRETDCINEIQKVEEFKKMYGSFDDGLGSKTASEKIYSIISGED